MKKKKILYIAAIVVIAILLFLLVNVNKLTRKVYGPGPSIPSPGDISDDIKFQMMDDINVLNERLIFHKYVYDVRINDKQTAYVALRNELDEKQVFIILEKSNELSDTGIWDGGSMVDCYYSIDNKISSEKINGHIKFVTYHSIGLKPGEVGVFKLEIIPSSDAKPTTYSCAMVIQNPEDGSLYARKDFFVTVT